MAKNCAVFDWEQVRRGLDLKAFESVFAPSCISFRTENGQLKSFDRKNVHCGNALPTAAGLLVLERQSMIYDFLYKVLGQVSEGSTAESKGSSEWNALAAQKFRRIEEVGTIYQHIDGIFHSPVPSISEISALVHGRLGFHEDELASLSSDAEYFIGHCAEYQAMRDTDPRSIHEQPKGATVTAVTLGAFQDLLCWHLLDEALKGHLAVVENGDTSAEYQDTFLKVTSLGQHMLFRALDDFRLFILNSQ